MVTLVGSVLLLLGVVVPALAGDLHPANAAAPTGDVGDQIAAYAASQAGVAYCDGGGTIHGPSNGGVVEQGCGPGVVGFDCMSLVQYAVFQATGIALPGDGSQPKGVGTFIAPQATGPPWPHRWWGWQPTPPPAGTGWWRPTAGSSASTRRSTAPAEHGTTQDVRPYDSIAVICPRSK